MIHIKIVSLVIIPLVLIESPVSVLGAAIKPVAPSIFPVFQVNLGRLPPEPCF